MTATEVQPSDSGLDRLFRSGTLNATFAWGLTTVLLLVFVESVLDADLQWIIFVGAAAAIVLVSPVAYRDWRMMMPAELLVFALSPVLIRALLGGTVGLFATYVSVAAMALLVTVQLDMFTDLDLTSTFAVVFVVMTTLATGAAWVVVRWTLDRTVGSTYLTTNEALMGEFTWMMAAGLAAGVVFDAYFRRRDRQLREALQKLLGR